MDVYVVNSVDYPSSWGLEPAAIRRGAGVSAARTGACRGAMTRGLTSAGAMTHIAGSSWAWGCRGVGTGAGRGGHWHPGHWNPGHWRPGTTRHLDESHDWGYNRPAQSRPHRPAYGAGSTGNRRPGYSGGNYRPSTNPGGNYRPGNMVVRPTTAITEARTVRPLPPETALIRMIITARRTIAVADVTTITAELAATANYSRSTAITTGAFREALSRWRSGKPWR